eukprot:SAG31_NODE_1864_length_7036_cov_3.477584_1_plen_127_part_10
MVVQDDRVFLRQFEHLARLCKLMCSDASLGYVLLPTAKQRGYTHRMTSLAGSRGIKGAVPDARSFDTGDHVDSQSVQCKSELNGAVGSSSSVDCESDRVTTWNKDGSENFEGCSGADVRGQAPYCS